MHTTNRRWWLAGVLWATASAVACGGAAPKPAVEDGAEAAEQVAAEADGSETAGGEQAQAAPEVQMRELTYEVDGQTFTGYLAIAARATPGPAVLVVHEWWGHNEFVRDMAQRLGEQGYTALALDMYGEGKVTEHPEDAKRFMQAAMSDLPAAERRIAAAYELLSAEPTVDADRVGAIGFCFGGGVVLHAMRAQVVPLEAVVSFHGVLQSHLKMPPEPGSIGTKVLVLTGGADPFVPTDVVAAFEAEMRDAQVDYRVEVYPDAKHAFMNPGATARGEQFGMPLAYDAEVATQAWQEMVELFEAEL